MFLRFGVDVSEDVDVRVVDPEPAEQRGHPDGDAQAIMNKRCVESKKNAGYSSGQWSEKTIFVHRSFCIFFL